MCVGVKTYCSLTTKMQLSWEGMPDTGCLQVTFLSLWLQRQKNDISQLYFFAFFFYHCHLDSNGSIGSASGLSGSGSGLVAAGALGRGGSAAGEQQQRWDPLLSARPEGRATS